MPFCRRHFEMHFLEWTFSWIWIKISLKYVSKGPINTIPVLGQIMAWCRPGDKPLCEPMMVRLPMHICVTRPQWGIVAIWCHQELTSSHFWCAPELNYYDKEKKRNQHNSVVTYHSLAGKWHKLLKFILKVDKNTFNLLSLITLAFQII